MGSTLALVFWGTQAPIYRSAQLNLQAKAEITSQKAVFSSDSAMDFVFNIRGDIPWI